MRATNPGPGDLDQDGPLLEEWENLCRALESVADTFRCNECPQLACRADQETRDFLTLPVPEDPQALRERRQLLDRLAGQWRDNSVRLPRCESQRCDFCYRRAWQNIEEGPGTSDR